MRGIREMASVVKSPKITYKKMLEKTTDIIRFRIRAMETKPDKYMSTEELKEAEKLKNLLLKDEAKLGAQRLVLMKDHFYKPANILHHVYSVRGITGKSGIQKSNYIQLGLRKHESETVVKNIVPVNNRIRKLGDIVEVNPVRVYVVSDIKFRKLYGGSLEYFFASNGSVYISQSFASNLYKNIDQNEINDNEKKVIEKFIEKSKESVEKSINGPTFTNTETIDWINKRILYLKKHTPDSILVDDNVKSGRKLDLKLD